MAELERLTVVLETRLTGYTRGMRAAAKQALGLASDIEKAGDRADASAKKAEGAFARVSRAIREARTEANRGAEFKVSADERPAGGPRSGPWPSARAGILSRMQPHERRRRLQGYFAYYYDELGRQLPNYTSDPESVPRHLRPYDRIVQLVECRDGYVVLHKPDPENVHNTPTATTFEVESGYRDRTVGELVEKNLPSDAHFWVTEAFYLKNEDTGEYVATEPWERRDFVANRRIEQWTSELPTKQTGEEGIKQAQEDLRAWFDRAPSGGD